MTDSLNTSTPYNEQEVFLFGNREQAEAYVAAAESESSEVEDVTNKVRPNPKLWFTSGSNSNGEWDSHANDLANSKAAELAKVKRRAAEILAYTDYAILEALESGESIPSDIAAHRAEVKDVCAKREADVLAAATVDELSLAITNAWSWPTPYGEPRES